MMQKVKYGIAFGMGSIYTSTWWILATTEPYTPSRILPTLVVLFGTVFIGVGVVRTIVIHWDD